MAIYVHISGAPEKLKACLENKIAILPQDFEGAAKGQTIYYFYGFLEQTYVMARAVLTKSNDKVADDTENSKVWSVKNLEYCTPLGLHELLLPETWHVLENSAEELPPAVEEILAPEFETRTTGAPIDPDTWWKPMQPPAQTAFPESPEPSSEEDPCMCEDNPEACEIPPLDPRHVDDNPGEETKATCPSSEEEEAAASVRETCTEPLPWETVPESCEGHGDTGTILSREGEGGASSMEKKMKHGFVVGFVIVLALAVLVATLSRLDSFRSDLRNVMSMLEKSAAVAEQNAQDISKITARLGELEKSMRMTARNDAALAGEIKSVKEAVVQLQSTPPLDPGASKELVQLLQNELRNRDELIRQLATPKQQ
ncbi:hypothetical protein [Aminiphilus circumscriptus]|uniref:hypothetical protein n=1 Tax=Aminiphilus circumscriptus TaxID=290732 RepID=UPI000492B329|nr:hypothetical protein [Aminiphilus circumscriptus]